MDDICDKGQWTDARILEAVALGNQFYSSRFYRSNREKLQMTILVETGLWQISVAWEKDAELWKRQFADVLRHTDVMFLGAVCMLCCGWDASVAFSRAFLCAGYIDHADRYGIPQ